MATSVKNLTVQVVTVEAEKPHASFDGGVWHCDGRLVTREAAKSAFGEALFWLAIHDAEQCLSSHERMVGGADG